MSTVEVLTELCRIFCKGVSAVESLRIHPEFLAQVGILPGVKTIILDSNLPVHRVVLTVTGSREVPTGTFDIMDNKYKLVDMKSEIDPSKPRVYRLNLPVRSLPEDWKGMSQTELDECKATASLIRTYGDKVQDNPDTYEGWASCMEMLVLEVERLNRIIEEHENAYDAAHSS